MSILLRRREFIAGLGGAAAWPVAALAQHPAMPVVGFVNGAARVASAKLKFENRLSVDGNGPPGRPRTEG